MARNVIPILRVLMPLSAFVLFLGHVYAGLLLVELGKESTRLDAYVPLYVAGVVASLLILGYCAIQLWRLLAMVAARTIFSQQAIARIDTLIKAFTIHVGMIVALGIFYWFAIMDGGPVLIAIELFVLILGPTVLAGLKVGRNVFVSAVNTIEKAESPTKPSYV